MKLRIRGNSIRLRLLRGEIAEFAANKILRETINFGVSKLAYILQATGGAETLTAHFAEGEIIVGVPTEMANQWTQTELISLTGEQKLADGGALKILVEKDFVCLDRPNDEDNNDAYPNLSHKC